MTTSTLIETLEMEIVKCDLDIDTASREMLRAPGWQSLGWLSTRFELQGRRKALVEVLQLAQDLPRDMNY